MTPILDPLAIIFASIIAWGMGSIIMYEYYILGNTWDPRDETEIELDSDDLTPYEYQCESIICNLLS